MKEKCEFEMHESTSDRDKKCAHKNDKKINQFVNFNYRSTRMNIEINDLIALVGVADEMLSSSKNALE